MDLGDGMVAVVRGLPDAALAVTLLEGNRQYTLMPNAVHQQTVPAHVHVHQKPHPQTCSPLAHHPPQPPCSPPPQRQYAQPQPQQYQLVCTAPQQPQPQPQQQQQHCNTELQVKTHMHCNSSAQVVDGRYASVYKMAHCNVQPTSPPVQLTEFPPQRAELCRGHGNFEVGGLGSGETNFSPTRANGTFRGAMNWPDRGAVFTPRASQEPDAFASSLRKYPSLSPDRSSEMVERLINYTQNKNLKCQQPRSQGSPSRTESSAPGSQCCDRRTSIAASLRCRNDSELNFRARMGEESPTREPARRPVEEARLFSRSYDVRHLRDVTKRAKDSVVRNLATYPYSLPVCPNIKQRYDHLPPERKPDIIVTNSVNMETQAEIVKVSKEVATIPREKISKRDVAVPLSPCASHLHSSKLQLVSPELHPISKCCKAVQTCKPKHVALKIRKSSQTCSSIEIPQEKKHNAKIARRSKSQEELKINGEQDENLLLLIKKESVKYGLENKKEEISVLLSDLLNVNKQEAIYFVNNVVYNLKDIFNKPTPSLHDATRPHNFLVYRHDTSMQTNTTNYSIEGINEQDIKNNIDRYNKQLVQEISDWMVNIRELNEIDIASKQAVANNLAGDIIDRYKYLELNPDSSGSDVDELENFKYQIFKRINKLIEPEILDNVIGHATDLMSKLQNIPRPLLTRSDHSVVCSKPNCCCHGEKSDYKSTTRLSSSTDNPCQKCENARLKHQGTSQMTETYAMEQKRRQSEPSADFQSDSIRAMSYKENEHMTQNSCTHNCRPVGASSRQNMTHTEMNAPRLRMARMRGTSMIESPSAANPTNRRLSAPPYLPPGAMRPRVAIQTPPSGPGLEGIEERHASTSLAPPIDIDDTQPAVGPSVSQLNDQYDEFLYNWVQKIPITSTNPEEEALAEKMRLGIYNGVWKAITKIKLNPAVLANEFYYQDLLDDEVEQLLDLLPENPELIKQRKQLKSEIVEKTTGFHKQIVAASANTSFKEQLVESVAHNIHRRTIGQTEVNIDQLVEEIQKLNLAADFIMYTKYKEDDKVKAKVFKNKIDKHIQELIDDIKKNHGKEVKDIDLGSYKDEIMKALYKVPLPNNETIKQEADEIQIGFEIEQWFNNLPLYPEADNLDALCRRRYRDDLAKKIHDMGKLVGMDCYEDHLRPDIYKFIEKLPLNPEHEGNIEFFIDELVNRLKNRHRDELITGSGLRRPGFEEPNDYDDFSRDMQLCSSYCQGPDPKKDRDNASSYLIFEGERFGGPSKAPAGHYGQQYYQPATIDSQQEWFSLEETRAPSIMVSRRRDRKSLGQEPVQLPSRAETSTAPQYAENRSPSRRTSTSIQTAPSVKIQEEVVEADGPRYSPCHESSVPAQGSMRRRSQVSHMPMQPQDFVPGSPRAMTSGHKTSGNATCGHGTSGNASCGNVKCCEKVNLNGQERSPTPTSRSPEGSTQPCGYCSAQVQADLPKSGESSRRFSGRADAPYMYDFSGQPAGVSTPHQPIPSCHESRPKKRNREVDRSMREAARKRLELEDTEDSEREELRCRCMERIWRCKKKIPMYMTCDDFDMEFPPCFPLRCPCPYYF